VAERLKSWNAAEAVSVASILNKGARLIHKVLWSKGKRGVHEALSVNRDGLLEPHYRLREGGQQLSFAQKAC
jgi:hypothetical protein